MTFWPLSLWTPPAEGGGWGVVPAVEGRLFVFVVVVEEGESTVPSRSSFWRFGLR